mmetsp:Transcript_24058/g.30074  ORF Transcript_24058/g.30074 Transcript_24058/m.30074 type:complete len:794 (-) Transcript_24058:228-2609(-)
MIYFYGIFAMLATLAAMQRTSAFIPQTRMAANSRASKIRMSLFADGPKTLFDKIWDDHYVTDVSGTPLIYIDRHLVHEVTSPQAFDGLRLSNRVVRRPDCTLVTVDHNVPTEDRSSFQKGEMDIEKFLTDIASRQQVMALEKNVEEFGLKYFGMTDKRQGIVHIIGPEQGFTLPGTTCVCGDSHTATHGAFGALAFGIGTSEVEHVLATQCLPQKKAQNMLIDIEGPLAPGVTSKDIVLHVCGLIGTAGGTGCAIEFSGEAIRSLSMEARMSISNMAIEAGARAGLIAPDEVTFEYLKDRPMCPQSDSQEWADAIRYWNTLKSDEGAKYDKVVKIKASDIAPTVTWGTSPQDTAPITSFVPDPNSAPSPERKAGMERSLEYMGLQPGQKLDEIPIEKVFIGSCTNGRIEDIREVAKIAEGRKVPDHVHAMIVPGSGLVKEQAEAEGLDVILKEAGFDWREPGCSMCLAMNPDKLKPQERCASTSNRNFEGRQGNGGRTHLLSPAMAAAAAVTGKLTDARDLKPLGTAGSTPAASATQSTTKPNIFPSQGPVINLGSKQVADAEASSGPAGFTTLKGVAAALDIQNIDTDMIIPKEYLKTIKRAGLGFAAFAELRYENPDDVAKLGADIAVDKPDFVLNKEPWTKTKILVAGDNFGCGSSREHAPWAIKDQGIECIISTSFADIFYNNCFKNGMLPLTLPRENILPLIEDAEAGLELEIDLPNQKVIRANGESYSFEIDESRKHNLMNGLDDIGLTLAENEKIMAFEKSRSQNFPWLDGATTRIADLDPVIPQA